MKIYVGIDIAKLEEFCYEIHRQKRNLFRGLNSPFQAVSQFQENIF
jgi:hypothetical protein